MATYISKLRRGVKDDAGGRNDWETYTAQDNHIKPQDGELVLEYDNGVPRLKIGDGDKEFSELPYMSVDSFILPKQEYISLSTEWKEDADKRHYQEVDVIGATVTSKSKIDLQPTAEQLSIFREKDVTFVAENTGGAVRVYCIGQVPKNEYEKIPVTVTEIVTEETTIIGNTTATPYPRPDWNQDDPTKPDYIKNKPSLDGKIDKATTLDGYGITDAVRLTKTEGAYCNKSDGTQTNISVVPGEAKPWTIPQRGANGIVYVGNPTENKHAANKEYVDTAIASMSLGAKLGDDFTLVDGEVSLAEIIDVGGIITAQDHLSIYNEQEDGYLTLSTADYNTEITMGPGKIQLSTGDEMINMTGSNIDLFSCHGDTCLTLNNNIILSPQDDVCVHTDLRIETGDYGLHVVKDNGKSTSEVAIYGDRIQYSSNDVTTEYQFPSNSGTLVTDTDFNAFKQYVDLRRMSRHRIDLLGDFSTADGRNKLQGRIYFDIFDRGTATKVDSSNQMAIDEWMGDYEEFAGGTVAYGSIEIDQGNNVYGPFIVYSDASVIHICQMDGTTIATTDCDPRDCTLKDHLFS